MFLSTGTLLLLTIKRTLKRILATQRVAPLKTTQMFQFNLSNRLSNVSTRPGLRQGRRIHHLPGRIGTEGQARLRARRPAWPSVDPSGFSGLAFSASRRKRPRSNLRNFPFPVSQLCRRGEGSTQRLFGLEIGCEEKSTTTFSFHPQCVALFTFRLAFCGPSFSDGRLGEVSISHKESKLQAFPISHFPFPPNTI